jgi:hypothetical protein
MPCAVKSSFCNRFTDISLETIMETPISLLLKLFCTLQIGDHCYLTYLRKSRKSANVFTKFYSTILYSVYVFYRMCLPAGAHCPHCNGNSVYIFLFWELRGLSRNFNIHVSLSYIFPGSVHIFPPAEKADPSWECIICSQTHECRIWLRPRYSFSGNICF